MREGGLRLDGAILAGGYVGVKIWLRQITQTLGQTLFNMLGQPFHVIPKKRFADFLANMLQTSSSLVPTCRNWRTEPLACARGSVTTSEPRPQGSGSRTFATWYQLSNCRQNGRAAASLFEGLEAAAAFAG